METENIENVPEGHAPKPDPRAALLQLTPSGIIQYFTTYDAVKMFCIGAQGRGVCHLGKIQEQCPTEVLETRRRVIDEEVNAELMGLLNTIITNGTCSLEQKAEMLDHICDSIYVLLGLAVNLGLPFDTGMTVVHSKNMEKVMGQGRPIFREDGKVAKPENWEGPGKLLFGVVLEAVRLATVQDSHQNPKSREAANGSQEG